MCGTCKCAETLLHWIVKWWRLFPFILFDMDQNGWSENSLLEFRNSDGEKKY